MRRDDLRERKKNKRSDEIGGENCEWGGWGGGGSSGGHSRANDTMRYRQGTCSHRARMHAHTRTRSPPRRWGGTAGEKKNLVRTLREGLLTPTKKKRVTIISRGGGGDTRAHLSLGTFGGVFPRVCEQRDRERRSDRCPCGNRAVQPHNAQSRGRRGDFHNSSRQTHAEPSRKISKTSRLICCQVRARLF